MTHNEMLRRLATIDAADLRRAHRAVLDGFGASGIVNGVAPLTRKQVNAVFDWVERYGRVCPPAGGAA